MERTESRAVATCQRRTENASCSYRGCPVGRLENDSDVRDLLCCSFAWTTFAKQISCGVESEAKTNDSDKPRTDHQ